MLRPVLDSVPGRDPVAFAEQYPTRSTVHLKQAESLC